MNGEQRAVAVLGVLALAGGCLTGFLFFRRLLLCSFDNAWSIGDAVMTLPVSAYLIWASIRAFRWSTGRVPDRSNEIKWGRIVLGATMVYGNVRAYAIPNAHGMLQPSNESEALGMHTGAIIFVIIGAWLLVTGVIAAFKRPPLTSSGSESQPAHDPAST